MKISVIMIAHNQIEFVKQGIKVIYAMAADVVSHLIIVDNASDDGLSEWLREDNRYDYVICGDGIEGYASILNTVIREFDLTDDVLVLSPYYMLLPNALQQMRRILYKKDDILAVSPSMILCDSETGTDYMTAVNFAEQSEHIHQPMLQKMGLEEGAVLLKGSLLKEVGFFDERLVLPRSGLLDFLFRGILKGYSMYECKDAFFYQMGIFANEYRQKFGIDVDRPVLKEKWDMNYFNIDPNNRMIACMEEEKEAAINVLEIGCDCGVNLLAAKNHYPNLRAWGVELNEHAAELASHIASVQTGNIEDKNLEFRDVKFDYIMFGDVLEHLRDPEETLRYCKTLLKPGGRILACIPNLMHYSVMHQLINGNFTYTDMGLLDRTHIHFFTYNEIERMFVNAGYHVESIENIDTEVTASPEEQAFVKNLTALSETAEPFMFYTFQYIVAAKCV